MRHGSYRFAFVPWVIAIVGLLPGLSVAVQDRDPFTPPAPRTRAPSVPPRAPRPETSLSDVALDGAVLTGIACLSRRPVRRSAQREGGSRGAAKADAGVIRSASSRTWAVVAGDRLHDARVVKVTCDGVMFERSAGARESRQVWRRLQQQPKQKEAR